MSIDRMNVLERIWAGVREPLIARSTDTCNFVIWCLCAYVVHVALILFLRSGWSPLAIHWMTIGEEYTVILSTMAFFAFQLYAVAWTIYRDTVGGFSK
jgi:hypothetical protein